MEGGGRREEGRGRRERREEGGGAREEGEEGGGRKEGGGREEGLGVTFPCAAERSLVRSSTTSAARPTSGRRTISAQSADRTFKSY